MNLYEQITGRNLIQDFGSAEARLMKLGSLSSVTKFAGKEKEEVENRISEIDKEEMKVLLEVITDPEIVEFMLALVPCMYTEVIDGRLVKNEVTYDKALNSQWVMNFVNVEFFTEVMEESKKTFGDSHIKAKKKVVRG